MRNLEDLMPLDVVVKKCPYCGRGYKEDFCVCGYNRDLLPTICMYNKDLKEIFDRDLYIHKLLLKNYYN